MKNNLLIKLFTVFFKLGLFTFGGGYAMLPLIHHETVEKNGWIDDAEMLDIIAVAESTPGPVIINTATFIGFKMAGFWGAFISTFGVALPSYVIIIIVSFFYKQFRDNIWVGCAFYGINAAVGCLVLKSLVKLLKPLKASGHMIFNAAVAVAAFLLMAVFKLKAVYVIMLAAVCGMIYGIFTDKPEKGETL